MTVDPEGPALTSDDGLGPGVANPAETLGAADATRRLIAALRVADAPAEVLAKVTDLVDEARDLLHDHAVDGVRMQGGVRMRESDPGPDRFDTESRDLTDPGRFFPYSPVIGPWNPIAPPAVLRWDGERIRGTATFGATHVGPPNMVHGGVIALLFDEALGAANVCEGVGGFTGTLTVRYERPTPLDQELELEAQVATAEGRKVITRGTISHGGEVTARAEGVFIRVSM